MRLPSALLLSLFLLQPLSGIRAMAQTPATRSSALAAESSGNLDRALELWTAFVKAHPHNAEAWAHMGLIEAYSSHYDQAIAHDQKALALDPKQSDTRMNLGLAQFKSGHMADAITSFTPLLAAVPANSPEAQRLATLLAMAHYGLGQYDQAVPLLRRVTSLDPTNLPYRMLLDQSCLWARQYQCVLDVYKEILNLGADSAEADMLAGEAYDEMHNSDGAIRQFRAAIAKNPNQPMAHFALAYMLWRTKQFPEAEQEFSAELANFPAMAEALALLADCRIQLTHPAGAEALLRKALALNNNLERAHLDLGILLSDADDKSPATHELETAMHLDPNDVEAHWHLAKLYQATGRHDDAKRELVITQQLHKQANDTIFAHLHSAQDKGPDGNLIAPPPAQ